MRIHFSLALLIWAALCGQALTADDVTVSSPDGRVQFRLRLTGAGFEYGVTFNDRPVVEASALAITVDGVNLAQGAEIGKVDRYQVNETYPWYGVHSTAVDKCTEAKVSVRHRRSRTAFTVEIRAYNDGIAFRHIVPGEGTRVPDEATTFRVPPGSVVWFHDLEDHYEGAHKRKRIAAVPEGAWLAPPVTCQLPNSGGYASITEAALRNYAGMALEADGAGIFHARLGHAVPPSWPFRLRFKADVARLVHPAAIAGTITTPWRLVMVGPDLNTLVNCDIIHNLAPPPDPKFFPDGLRTEWLKPGRVVWAYLDGGDKTFEGMKEFSRLAGELGFEYNLLEGFWAKWPESQLKELVDYSRERRVKIMIWKNRASLGTPEQIPEFFAMCRRTGVAGVKFDFFDHEAKEVIDLYESLLRAAAEYKLIVDFHGANKPTGQERTWPNELGLEGVRGMENSAPWAQQDVTLPFTRMLAGLADYTPMHFGRKLADTTWAHQIANAAILQAPLLCYAAHPANILANPAVDMIKSIPSVWDETVVQPSSEIGETAVFARRKGETWFLAVTNGHNARAIRASLSFLAEGPYKSMLVHDADEAASVKIEHVTLSRTDVLSIRLRSGGGFIGRFAK